jgi:hypothetical protein
VPKCVILSPKTEKSEVSLPLFFQFEELQFLSIKYIVYGACEETILSLNKHQQTYESGIPQSVSIVKKV